MKKIFLALVLFTGIGFTASAQSNDNTITSPSATTAPATEVTPVTPAESATAPVIAVEPAAVKSCCSSKKGKETASAKACCSSGKKSKASCGDKKEDTSIAQ